jgi:3-deoxy-7-phosphoheptulonate synthase
MIILLRKDGAKKAELVAERTLLSHGISSRRHVDPDSGNVALLATGPGLPLPESACAELRRLPGVEAVLLPPETLPLVAAAGPEVIVHGPRGEVRIGMSGHGNGEGKDTVGSPVLIAGPCAVESEDQLRKTAAAVRLAAPPGRAMLRGGAYKPRTSPYGFQGMGESGLHLLRRIGDEFGLPVVSEALDEGSLEEVAETCQVVQIGTRTMAAFGLLRKAARVGRPILLKRGFGATVEEWLHAAEHLLAGGAPGVILCERGIRTFERSTRATLDLSGLSAARLRTRLPILVDPSHAAGTRELVRPLAMSGMAAGASGLLIECHPRPEDARSDAAQALTLPELGELFRAASAVADAARMIECTNRWSETPPGPPDRINQPGPTQKKRSNGSACG